MKEIAAVCPSRIPKEVKKWDFDPKTGDRFEGQGLIPCRKSISYRWVQ
jgi:hypothetical protein